MEQADGRPGNGLKMYEEMASWFHLLTAPAEYADEATFILEALRSCIDGPFESLLELGAGGGNIASHLRPRLRLTLTDLSPAMLDLSRTINPDCEHLIADMRTVRLGQTFDAVLIHDAIMYMTTETELREALTTAFVHTRAGGAAIFAPDCTRETYKPGTEHGGHDDRGRGLRYLEWSYDPDPADTSYVSEFAVLLREGRQDVQVRYDRHVMGVFPRETWLRLVRETGFEPSILTSEGRDVFLGKRPCS